jgi:hypothetical protein
VSTVITARAVDALSRPDNGHESVLPEAPHYTRTATRVRDDLLAVLVAVAWQ